MFWRYSTKKYKLQDELHQLRVEKSVIAWQQQNPNATEEGYDSWIMYYDEQRNKAGDG